MKVKIPETFSNGSCHYRCTFLTTGQDGCEECMGRGGIQTDNFYIKPGPTCPGPGFYELVPESKVIALRELIELLGGNIKQTIMFAKMDHQVHIGECKLGVPKTMGYGIEESEEIIKKINLIFSLIDEIGSLK